MVNTLVNATGLPAASSLDFASLKSKSETQSKAANADRSAGTATRDTSKDMFLTLMVAQLKYQNPLNPVEGTEFLQQLSQISGVEQMVEMRKQLEAIHQLLRTSSSGTDAT